MVVILGVQGHSGVLMSTSPSVLSLCSGWPQESALGAIVKPSDADLLVPGGTVWTDEVKIQWMTTDSCFLWRKTAHNELPASVVPRLGPDCGDDFLWLPWLTFHRHHPDSKRLWWVTRRKVTERLVFIVTFWRFDWCVSSKHFVLPDNVTKTVSENWG